MEVVVVIGLLPTISVHWDLLENRLSFLIFGCQSHATSPLTGWAWSGHLLFGLEPSIYPLIRFLSFWLDAIGTQCGKRRENCFTFSPHPNILKFVNYSFSSSGSIDQLDSVGNKNKVPIRMWPTYNWVKLINLNPTHKFKWEPWP